tara:strand:+ start:983 stop:1264 length:282 start_codon:yes stop_codon:yes gene_type:complete
MDIKVTCWEQVKDSDNTKHTTLNENVDFVSVGITENNLSLTEEPHPKCLDVLKEMIKFKGNIRLSASGNSYNIWRDKLNKDADMVTISLPSTN